MKKNTTTMAIAALLIVAGATISSCKKDSKTTGTSTVTTDTNTSSAQDHQDAENNSNDVDQMGAEGMDNGNINSNYKTTASGSGLLTPMSGSANVTVVGKIMTLTFSNYVGLDGHKRTGTLVYDFSGSLATATHYRDSGIVISVTTPNHDYYVDSNKVEVTKTITNKGRDVSTHNLTWHVTTSLTITKANNGGTIQWSATRDNILLNTNANFSYNGSNIQASFSGYTTPINWSTAVIGITGSATGTSADNVGFTANISSMLVRNFNCSPSLLHTHFHPFVAGQIDFTPSGKTTRSINFGAGTCDESYKITIGSWSINITWIL